MQICWNRLFRRRFKARWAAPGGAAALVAVIGLSLGVAAASRAEDPAPPPVDPAIYGLDLDDDARGHWSFQSIRRPNLPVLSAHQSWVQNPIDAFVLARLHERGLEPAPPVDPLKWLRRVTFDLTGLPPTPEEVEGFLADTSPTARERVVDRLLASPSYGIRWGRRWLDVVRYADTNGYERDGEKPHAWRYRDYVIDSLNADKPFDRFLTEHLAGDELPEANAETMIATTFLRLGTWDDEPAEELVDRYDQLDDVVGTVSATFLGLTLRCARCHNHKFEPLSQIDYTRILAVFEPLKRPQTGRKEHDVAVGTRYELDEANAAQSRYAVARSALEDQLKATDARARDRLLATGSPALAEEILEAHRRAESERTDEQKKLVKESQPAFDAEVARLRTATEKAQHEGFVKALAALEAAAPAPLPRAYLWEEHSQPRVTQVFRRGNPTTPAGLVAPGIPDVLAHSAVPAVAPIAGARTSQRRLALARWMTAPSNPLVARVIVNRLWQGHFGNGLVATENDFGVMGSGATHPELLDWLASELREPALATGEADPPRLPWGLKHIHRLIVLSNAYGQDSRFREEAARVDVENSLLWRFPYRRLDAEAVRDAVLASSGSLNPERGGPGVYPKIAREVLEGQSRPGEGWGPFDEKQANRRAIYIYVKRSLLVPEMELLDFADTTTSCEQRPVSTIPTQALTLMNGEFLNQQAARLASRLEAEVGENPAAQVERGYRLVLSRAPAEAEVQAAAGFLERQAEAWARENGGVADDRAARQAALQALCLVLLNLNEFAYVD